MSNRISVPRGTADVLPAAAPAWSFLENTARKLFQAYHFSEIRTPMFEEGRLFTRSLGQTSDIVNKQLLYLQSTKDDPFALRPEGTAAVVRTYIENSLHREYPLSKLFYIGPMFRGERPQKGRLRQFHQIGVEAMGENTSSPYLDAEMIILATNLLQAFGVKEFEVQINTLGTPEDKQNFTDYLRKELTPYRTELSEYSQDRFDRNVLRILDSKDKKDKDVLTKIKLDNSYLSAESQDFFAQVKKCLDSAQVKYTENPRLVRGLDYYTHTVFEIVGTSLGSQDALGAGGRYNNLVKELGGPAVDAVGFALGMERILLTLEGKSFPEQALDYFIVCLAEQAFDVGFKLMQDLRAQGKSVDLAFKGGSVKSQMRQANKAGADKVLILGEEEIKNQTVTVKDMQTGEQEVLGLSPNGDCPKLLEKTNGDSP